jgi:hypothetical protein
MRCEDVHERLNLEAVTFPKCRFQDSQTRRFVSATAWRLGTHESASCIARRGVGWSDVAEKDQIRTLAEALCRSRRPVSVRQSHCMTSICRCPVLHSAPLEQQSQRMSAPTTSLLGAGPLPLSASRVRRHSSTLQPCRARCVASARGSPALQQASREDSRSQTLPRHRVSGASVQSSHAATPRGATPRRVVSAAAAVELYVSHVLAAALVPLTLSAVLPTGRH